MLVHSLAACFELDSVASPRSGKVLQASNNLTNWVSLVTNVAPFEMDPALTNRSEFYRTLRLP